MSLNTFSLTRNLLENLLTVLFVNSPLANLQVRCHLFQFFLTIFPTFKKCSVVAVVGTVPQTRLSQIVMTISALAGHMKNTHLVMPGKRAPAPQRCKICLQTFHSYAALAKVSSQSGV